MRFINIIIFKRFIFQALLISIITVMLSQPMLVSAADIDSGYSCQTAKVPGATVSTCQPDPVGSVFGQIQPPSAITALGNGSTGISKFLNNLIILIYMIAAVVFIFMMVWGALQWLISGGDKEAVAGARNRIIHAIIGIMLFAAAFALIQILGTFTGFKFF